MGNELDNAALEVAYIGAQSAASQVLGGEPEVAYTSLGMYFTLCKHFNPQFKLPRKMKKRYLGTRDRKRRQLKRGMKAHKITLGFELEQLEVH